VSRIFLFTQTGGRLKHHAGKGPHIRDLIARHKLEVEQADNWWVVHADNARDARNYIARSTEGRIMAKGGKHRGRPEIQPPPLPGGGGTTGGGVAVTGGFPRIWMYWGTNFAGIPIQTSPGVFDMDMVARLARWNLVTLNTRPWRSFLTPDASYPIDTLLRAENPDIKLVWYDILQTQFRSVTPGSMVKAMWDVVSSGPDKRLFQLDGNSFPNNKPALYEVDQWWDVAATPTEAAEMVAVWQAYLYGKGGDGFFVDWFNNAAVPGTVSPLDYARAGYASLQAIKDANLIANADFATRLKAIGDMLFVNRADLALNLDDATTFNVCTGEIFEGWDPDQGQGGGAAPGNNPAAWTFDSAMTHGCRWQGANPTDDGWFLIKGETGSATPSTSAKNKLMRYCLGCACVTGGLSYVGNNRNNDSAGTSDDTLFWADEYAVNLSTGTTDETGAAANRGWLGRPTEFGSRDSGTGMWTRRFTNGMVIVNGPGSSHTYTLPAQMRRIQGFYDTTVNDGSLVTSVTVPSKDARFLLNA